MSLKSTAIDPIPEQTARICKAAYPKGNLYMKMRDEFGTLFEDAQFADLFPKRGQPAQAPWRLALITLMQFVEGLSDRQAAEAVQGRLDWKYALSLELEDSGFDSSVLCEFRTRLIAGEAEERLFEIVLKHFSERNLLKVRGRQRTDSTHVLARVSDLNRLELIGETVRYALNSLAEAAPNWLMVHVEPEWFDRYGSRMENYRLPRESAARDALALRIGADGRHLLQLLWSAETDLALRRLPACEMLRRVWLQQFVVEDATWRCRLDRESPPCSRLIISPYDADARFSTKRQTEWTGYKVHLTESCDAEAPRLITDVQTTPATTPDSQTTLEIEAALKEADRLPSEHLVDKGYTQASHLVESRKRYNIELVGPVTVDGSRQKHEKQGFDITAFTVDWEKQQVSCPAGKTSLSILPTRNTKGTPYLLARFAVNDCRECPHRSLCTRSKTSGRTLYLHPKAEYEALHQAREEQHTHQFQKRYAARCGIEGTLSRGVRAFGLRRSRYIGQTKTHLQHLLVAAATNFCRVFEWLSEIPIPTTRQSRFKQLKTALMPA